MRVAEALDGKFWDYHQVVFHNQDGENDGAFTRDRLADMAELVGLDRDDFLRQMDDPSYRAAVEAEVLEGAELGINSTPTLVVNGELIRARRRGKTSPPASRSRCRRWPDACLGASHSSGAAAWAGHGAGRHIGIG